MNIKFNLGKVHVPTPFGTAKIEDISFELKHIEMDELLTLAKTFPELFSQSVEEKEEESPSASILSDILGDLLKSKSGDSPFGPGFPFGEDSPFHKGVHVEDVEHPLFGKGKAIGIDPSKFMNADIAGDISKFIKSMKKQDE